MKYKKLLDSIDEEETTADIKKKFVPNHSKRIKIQNKTEVSTIIDTWSWDSIKLMNKEQKKVYGYISVVIDSFSQIAWTIPLKNEYGKPITDSFSNSMLNPKDSLI